MKMSESESQLLADAAVIVDCIDCEEEQLPHTTGEDEEQGSNMKLLKKAMKKAYKAQCMLEDAMERLAKQMEQMEESEREQRKQKEKCQKEKKNKQRGRKDRSRSNSPGRKEKDNTAETGSGSSSSSSSSSSDSDSESDAPYLSALERGAGHKRRHHGKHCHFGRRHSRDHSRGRFPGHCSRGRLVDNFQRGMFHRGPGFSEGDHFFGQHHGHNHHGHVSREFPWDKKCDQERRRRCSRSRSHSKSRQCKPHHHGGRKHGHGHGHQHGHGHGNKHHHHSRHSRPIFGRERSHSRSRSHSRGPPQHLMHHGPHRHFGDRHHDEATFGAGHPFPMRRAMMGFPGSFDPRFFGRFPGEGRNHCGGHFRGPFDWRNFGEGPFSRSRSCPRHC